MDDETIKKYISYMRALFSKVIKKEANIECKAYIYPQGVAIQILLGISVKNDNLLIRYDTQNEALKAVGLDRVIKTNSFEYMNFTGTNIASLGDEIILVKDLKEENWTEASAEETFITYLKGIRNGRK